MATAWALMLPGLLLAAVLLGGCGGTGSEEMADGAFGARLGSGETCANGEAAGGGQPCRGRLTLPGIDRIPLARIKRSAAQMRRLWAATDYYSEVNGSREHGRLIRRTSCWSYIVECGDPDDVRLRPFSYFQNYSHSGEYREIDYADAGLAPGDRHANAWFKRNLDGARVRLVSVSILPEGRGLVGQYGDAADYLVVQSAGNEGSDAFPVPADDPLFSGIRRAAAADKVVYVAGYAVDAGGEVVRHPDSSGCDAVPGACVWAPFETRGIGSGTSFGAPRVAAALASVLAVLPDTTHQDLARLVKASARKVDTLPNGLGVVDFTRLTTLDGSGEWRLVSGGGEFNDAVAPLELNDVVLPGDAAIASGFAISPGGEAVVFGTRLAGAFTRTAPSPLSGFGLGGAPVAAWSAEGLSVRLSRPGGDLHAGGVYEHRASHLFAAAGLGVRRDFFGLDLRHGYERAIGYEASAGHRDVFLRAARQTSEGTRNGLVRSAHGAAYGLTARRSVTLSVRTRIGAELHLDKFAGGRADTVFGAVHMEAGGWNRTLAAHLTHRAGGSVVVSAGAEVFTPARGETVWMAGLRVRVGPGVLVW